MNHEKANFRRIVHWESSPYESRKHYPRDPSIQIIPIVENQMEKKMENEMETRVTIVATAIAEGVHLLPRHLF